MSVKQDRCYTRTAEDLRRRLNVKSIDEATTKVDASVETVNRLNNEVTGLNNSLNSTRQNYVSTNNQTFTEEQKIRARNNIGAGNSSFSGSYEDLEDKPEFLSDINSIEGNKLSNIESDAQKNVIEVIKVNGVEQTPVNKAVNIITSSESPISYDLSNYKESSLTILRSSCIKKGDRVCVNFVGTISIAANNTTTLFAFPTAIRPTETKDFVVFGQTNNNDGYIGYGYLTDTGLLQVRFNVAITSYIRFSFVYDLD